MSARGVAPDRFRDLLGRFATGVTVLTTRTADGRVFGMTANAIASVSLEPPLLLVCVDRLRDMHDVLRDAPHFALNVLSRDQEALSRRFADEATDRFAGVTLLDGPHRLPLLPGVVAHIVCEMRETVAAGDHTIFVGHVVDGRSFGEGEPLTYYRGEYGGWIPQPERADADS